MADSRHQRVILMTVNRVRMNRQFMVSAMLRYTFVYAMLFSISACVTTNEGSPKWDGTWAMLPDNFMPLYQACCSTSGVPVPLTPKYQAVRDAYVSKRATGEQATTVSNSAECLPIGVPGVMTHPNMFEILFDPGRATLILNSGEVRRFWFNREHPAAEELEYPLGGHSIGRWEGAVLVVDTVGISADAEVFMSNGIHATQQTHVVERFILQDESTLKIETMVMDPEIFTAPYSYTVRYKKIPGSFEVGCDNRDNGSKTLETEVPAY